MAVVHRALARRSALLAVLVLASAELRAETLALLPVRRGARRPDVEEQVERALAARLARRFELIAASPTRDVLRRLRLRSPDGAESATLRALAAELGAAWIVTAAVHDVPDGPVPDLAISARLYDGASGSLVWSGFVGTSGLDHERLLGIGRIERFDALAERAVRELIEPLASAARDPHPSASSFGAARLGVVAIAPFTATVAADALEVSMTATEALRAVLADRGVRLSDPGCVRAGLRRGDLDLWGELTADARAAVGESCGAERIVTGSIERWEVAGTGLAPEPIVAVAIRLLDAESGRILWTGSLEAGGWDRPGLFGLRRVFSRGDLLVRLLERIGRNLLAADADTAVAMESSS